MTDVHPLTFRLPVGWEPRVAAVPGVDLAALYAIPDQGFTPTITVAVQPGPVTGTVEEVADLSVGHLRRAHPDLATVRRDRIGTPEAPGVAQEVRFTADVAGAAVELTQVHVVLATGPADRAFAVLKVALTATERQLPSLLPAFRDFVAGLRLGGPGAPS